MEVQTTDATERELYSHFLENENKAAFDTERYREFLLKKGIRKINVGIRING